MARRGERDRGRERFWRRMIRQWRRSGRSARAFCAEHRLSEPSFYSWRRVLAQRDHEAAPVRAKSERDSAEPASKEESVFVPLRVIDASAAAFEVVLEGGRVVRVTRGFDADTLRQLLAVLEEQPC